MDKLINWEHGKSEELKFWDLWLQSKGGYWKPDYDWTEDFRRRMDPESELQDYVAEEIRSRNMENPVILDLCAGPLTILNKNLDGKKLDITAIDALAYEYGEMLEKYGIDPLIKTSYGKAESYLKQNHYDVIHCSNGLDHSYDPLSAIDNMMKSLKKGGVIILKHYIKEGERGNYQGLHQWNFYENEDRCFIISDAAGTEINVSDYCINRFYNCFQDIIDNEIIVTIKH